MAFDPHNLEKKIKAEASSAFLSTGFHAQLVENYNSVADVAGVLDGQHEQILSKCVKELYNKYRQYGITIPEHSVAGGYVKSFRADVTGDQTGVTTSIADFLEQENNDYFLAEDGSLLKLEQDV